MTPPVGAGLSPAATDFAPLRAVCLQPGTSDVAGEFVPLRAVVIDQDYSEYAPLRAVVLAVKDIGLHMINQSGRSEDLGGPILHESIDL